MRDHQPDGPAPVPRPAPGFTLTDQDGRTVPLSGMHGKVVVLEFMDPHCTDICPLVSQEFVDAYHDLGRSAPNVVFAAVNVNQYFNKVPDVLAYSRAHELIAIPGWHFLTGPAAALQAVWRAYHVEVQAPSPDADIVHTAAVCGMTVDPATAPEHRGTGPGAVYFCSAGCAAAFDADSGQHAVAAASAPGAGAQ